MGYFFWERIITCRLFPDLDISPRGGVLIHLRFRQFCRSVVQGFTSVPFFGSSGIDPRSFSSGLDSRETYDLCTSK
jgi:hypothetical protein